MPRKVRRARTTVALAAVTLPLALLGAPAPVQAVVPACSGVPKDINGDGFADVAIGESGSGGGKVHVLYGTPTGLITTVTINTLSGLDDQVFQQGFGGVPSADVKGDFFGATTLLDDLNNDGCADLAIGVPGNDRRRGAVVILLGSTTGIRTTGARIVTQATVREGGSVPGANFGAALAAGDYNADGLRDLAVGAPFDGLPNGRTAGVVSVLYGTPQGVGAGGNVDLVTQDTAGWPGTAENGDAFGFALMTADFTADGIDDLVISSAGEDGDAGTVYIAPGTAGLRISARGARLLSQDTPGIPGTKEAGDDFGWSFAAGDLNGDSAPDLAIGVPGENGGRGVVDIILSDPVTKKLDVAGATDLAQGRTGVTGGQSASDFFGNAVAIGNFDSDAFADLAVGVPNDWLGTKKQVGSVILYKGSATGPTTAGYGGARFSQDSAGVPNDAETGDAFGALLATRRIQGGTLDSLVVAATGETLGTKVQAGAVTILPPTTNGLTGTGSQTLDPGTPGMLGERISNGFFGFAIDY